MPLYNPTSAGSSILNVTTITTTTTLTTSNNVVKASSAGGAYTISLFTAVGNSGRVLRIKKSTSDFNAITVDPAGAETIGGALTTSVNTVGEEIEIVSDGANWEILNRNFDQAIRTYTPATGGSGTWRREKNGLAIVTYQPLSGGLGGTYAPEIPTGLTIASADLVGTNQTVGFAWGVIAAVNKRYSGIVIYGGSTTVLIVGPDSGGAWGPSIPGTWASGDEINTNFWVPITGWSAN